MHIRVRRVADVGCFPGCAVAVALMLGAADTPAQQRTLDPALHKEIYANIVARKQDLQQTRAAVQPALKGFARDITERKSRLEELPAGDATRDELAAEIALLLARYIKDARILLDAAIVAVVGNLRDLDRLSKELRATAGPGNTQTYRQSIERDEANGRAMSRALPVLAEWAEDDPGLRAKFDALLQTLRILDNRIGTDRRDAGATGGPSERNRYGRYESYLNDLGEDLAGMLVRLEAERKRLDDLRAETLIAAETGKLKLVLAITKRDVPGLGSEATVSAELPGFTEVMDIVVDLNDGAVGPAAPVGKEAGAPVRPLEIPEFDNF